MASSAEGGVIACHTAEEWKTQYVEADHSNKLMVIDFTASWCGPCRFIAPFFAEMAKKMHHVVFLKVDVDELKEIAKEFKIEAMPTFVFVIDKKEVHRVVGADKGDLEKQITRLNPTKVV